MANDSTMIDASVFPRLVVRREGQVVREVTLQADLSIGRADDNDLRLDDPKVSRHHARVRREGVTYVLTDLGSANGTQVNGVLLIGPHPLQHGERVVIGDSELTYQEPGRASEDTLISPIRVSAQPARLVTPPQPAPVPEPSRRAGGGNRGLIVGLVMAMGVLLVAAVLVALYLAFGRERAEDATPTQPVAVVTTAVPTQLETSIAIPSATAELPTPEGTVGPATPGTPAVTGEELNDLLAQAEALRRRSKFEDATTIYQDLARRAPDDARPEVGWAWALIWDDEADQALAHAQRATQLDPASAEAAAVLARVYLETGDEAQALTIAQQAVQLDAGSAIAHAVLAEAYMVNGQLQPAVDEADQALVLDLNNADAHRIRGWLYHVADNDMGQAAGQLQVAAGLQPELWLRRHELGVLLLVAEDYTTAIMAFQDALGIRPKAVTYTAIGRAFYQLGQYDQASASLRQALAAGADDLDTYALLGATYAHQGRCDDARTYYESALALDATDPLALEAQDLCEGAMPSPTPSVTTVAPSVPTPVTTAEPTVTPRPTAPPPPPASLSGRIAFPVLNADTHQYDVYVAQAKDGSGRHLVVADMHQPALSSDGEWLAVNGTRHDQMNLFIVRPNGRDLKKITDFIEDNLPYWSPNGESIVLATTRDQPGHPQRIYILDKVPFVGRTEKGRLLAYPNGPVQGEYPTWTPDGQIIYKGCDYTVVPQDCGLFTIPASGGNFKKLTDNGEDTAPAAYGNKIAFMSNRNGNWEIYVMNADGSGLKRLTNNAANDGLPAFSPDGKTIAFVSDQGGPWAVWAIGPDGSNRRKLFNIGGGGLGYDWQHERISWAP